MTNEKKDFIEFLSKSEKSYTFNPSPITHDFKGMKTITFDGCFTISEMISNPIFTSNFGGNHSVFVRILEDIIPNYSWLDHKDLIEVMSPYHTEFLVSNHRKFFSERIFVNCNENGYTYYKGNSFSKTMRESTGNRRKQFYDRLKTLDIQFDSVKFRVFDEDEYDTTFSFRQLVPCRFNEILSIARKMKQNEYALNEVFR
jgi:hypothetical protein